MDEAARGIKDANDQVIPGGTVKKLEISPGAPLPEDLAGPFGDGSRDGGKSTAKFELDGE